MFQAELTFVQDKNEERMTVLLKAVYRVQLIKLLKYASKIGNQESGLQNTYLMLFQLTTITSFLVILKPLIISIMYTPGPDSDTFQLFA